MNCSSFVVGRAGRSYSYTKRLESGAGHLGSCRGLVFGVEYLVDGLGLTLLCVAAANSVEGVQRRGELEDQVVLLRLLVGTGQKLVLAAPFAEPHCHLFGLLEHLEDLDGRQLTDCIDSQQQAVVNKL